MPKTIFDSGAVATVHSRIDRLTAASQPLWGRMNVGQMVVHCDLQLRLALGEMTVAHFPSPVGRFPLKHLVLYVLPTPKSVPTMPELRDPVTGDWDQDRIRLKADVERVAARSQAQPWPVHAAFGTLTPRQWGILIWKHLDHHLKQFGA